MYSRMCESENNNHIDNDKDKAEQVGQKDADVIDSPETQPLPPAGVDVAEETTADANTTEDGASPTKETASVRAEDISSDSSSDTTSEEPVEPGEEPVEPYADPEQDEDPDPREPYSIWQAYDNDMEQTAGQNAQDRRREGRGVWIYAIVATAALFVCVCILLVVLLAGGRGIRTSSGMVENDPTTPEEMQPIYDAKRSVVVIEVVTASGSGTGTGVILNTGGYIATNHHVVEGAVAIRVTFLDGTHAEATIVGSSEMDDLAVIRVDPLGTLSQLVPATFVENVEDCYVGQTVYAIGTPGGAEFAFTTTRGIISYVNRTVKQYNSDGTLSKKVRTIQTDAMVNPGNSGGPLVDTEGRVVGIVSMKLGDGYEGIGFAIPSDGALEILEAIIRDGNADSINSSLFSKRPLLGIVGVYVEEGHTYVMDDAQGRIHDCSGRTVEEVRSIILQSGGTPGATISPDQSGIYVKDVTDGMGAAGKLQVGDIILSAESMRVTSMSGLMDVVNDMDIGDMVELKVERDGKTLTVQVELMAQSDN